MLGELGGAPLGAPEAAPSQAPANPSERRLLCLAFLAPDIQRAILEGRQPAGLTLQRRVLGRVPASWDEHRAADARWSPDCEDAWRCCQTNVDMSPPARSSPKLKLGLSHD